MKDKKMTQENDDLLDHTDLDQFDFLNQSSADDGVDYGGRVLPAGTYLAVVRETVPGRIKWIDKKTGDDKVAFSLVVKFGLAACLQIAPTATVDSSLRENPSKVALGKETYVTLDIIEPVDGALDVAVKKLKARANALLTSVNAKGEVDFTETLNNNLVSSVGNVVKLNIYEQKDKIDPNKTYARVSFNSSKSITYLGNDLGEQLELIAA